MSVVAGAAQVDYVILTSDTRITWPARGGIVRTVDFGLKLFPISRRGAIGFVAGDATLAGKLIRRVLASVPTLRRQDTATLFRWLPRILRRGYADLGGKAKVGFLAAGVLRGRPTLVPRKALLSLLDKKVFNPGLVTNTLPDFLVRSLMTPHELDPVPIKAAGTPLLCSMTSPNFKAVSLPPLSHVLIGSGRRATVEVNRYSDAIAGFGDQPAWAALNLREAVRRYVASEGPADVGGSFPALIVHAQGVTPLPYSMTVEGVHVELVFDPVADAWVQYNRTSGKSLALVEPWSLPAGAPSHDQRFDDWNEAWSAFLGK